MELSTAAELIDWSGSGIKVSSNRGTIRAKTCIVTVSNGVLSSNVIHFSPSLPERKQRAFSETSMGLYNHVAVQFKENFLGIGDDGYFIYKLKNLGLKSPRRFSGLVNVSGTTLSLFDLGGGFAWEMENLGARASIDFVISELKSIFGSKVDQQLVNTHATAWGINPFTLGSYASAEPGSAGLRKVLHESVGDRIFFAGEATSEDDWATVTGADKSGKHTANQVLRVL